MALDQSSLLELPEAHKLAEVDDRSRTATKMPRGRSELHHRAGHHPGGERQPAFNPSQGPADTDETRVTATGGQLEKRVDAPVQLSAATITPIPGVHMAVVRHRFSPQPPADL